VIFALALGLGRQVLLIPVVKRRAAKFG